MTSDPPAPPERAELRIPAADGRPLAATLHEGEAADEGSLRAAAVVAPAVGIERGFYSAYADYLASRSIAALTLDYRGTEGAAVPSAGGAGPSLTEWGRGDLEGAVSYLADRHPGAPLLLVGHSIGAQLLGLLERAERLSAVLVVASFSAYWRLFDPPARYRVWLLWYLLVPGLTAVLPHFPGGVFGLGGRLPSCVAREWARWGRSPHYVIDREGRPVRAGFRSVGGPVRAYTFTDDPLAHRRAVEEFLGYFGEETTEHVRLAPADVGAERIGHSGFFRERFRDSLWRESTDWLMGAIGGGPR